MQVHSSQHAFELLKDQFHPFQEEVRILALSPQRTLVKNELLFRGTADMCLTHPRDLLRILCLANASSFIMAHNHPSGQPLPSRQDLSVTRQIHKIGKLIQIPLDDHLIIAGHQYCSLADRGFFERLRKRSLPL